MDMNLTIKEYAHEVSWTFGSCDSTEKYTSNGQHTERCCLAQGEYTLSCKDRFGDGWHGGFMEIQGNRYCEDFEAGKISTHQVAVTGINVH